MKKRFIWVIIYFFISTINLSSAPAYPGLIEFIQPNGIKVNIYLKGDEIIKWAETTDGFTLLYNSQGYLEYAKLNYLNDLVPSGIMATNINERTSSVNIFLLQTQKKLFFSKEQINIYNQIREIYIQENKNIQSFPTTGNRRLICILIGFADNQFVRTQSEFNNLFNQIGYSADGAFGSVKDYFIENSYGQLNLTVDVAGPFVASQNMAHYGANDVNGNDVRPRELVLEAVNLADPTVNFSLYDNDLNGTVDGVYLIYAGFGEEAGGGANTIWAHAWSLATPVTRDGVSIQRYSCSAELRGSGGTSITRIGVIGHEFGHVLGAPDFYDTNSSTGGQFTGTGNWDMMASGSWNNSGARPAHFNGFTKVVYYNWATATVLNNPASITLHNAAENSNSFYRINTATNNEYFFIESRERVRFDTSIPGDGMIIYRVSNNVISLGTTNSINRTHPQAMYPVSQNATMEPTSTPSSYGSINAASAAWTGASSTKTAFTDTSIPSMKSWAGTNTNRPITNIFRNATNRTVSFDFMGGSQFTPTNFNANAFSSSQINLTWQLNANNNNVLIAFSTTPTFGNPVNGVVYSPGNSIPGGGTVIFNGNATNFSHINLNPNTTYFYTAWSVLAGNTYSIGVSANSQTHCVTFTNFPFAENFNSSTQLPACWNIIDKIGIGQVWQIGTHSGGLSGSTGNYAFLNSDGFGSGNSQNSDLISPLLNFSGFQNINLSFIHYYRHYTGSSATLSYSIDNGQNWTLIQTWNASTPNPATFNQTITALNNQSQVRFRWNYTGTYGWSWNVDNIAITTTPIISDLLVNNEIIIASNSTFNNLVINPFGKLTLNDGVTLTVNGNFTINSDALSTGTFVQLGNSTLNVAGNTSVNQYLTGSGSPAAPNGRMWYISSPVANATSNVFNAATASNKLWSYNESTFLYTEITNNTTALTVGSAFVARLGTTGNVTFTGGSLNNGSFSRSLTRTTNDKRGYHLLGNPYPSFVNPTTTMTNLANNLTPTIWYRTSIGAAMKFETFNYESGLGTAGLTAHIPPMQGFWVQVKGDGNTGTFTLNNSMRTHQTNNLLKTKFSNNKARILIDNGNIKDEAIILFNNSSGASFDDWDSEKMFNNNINIPEIYTKEASVNLVINSLSEFTSGLLVPLYMNIGTAGQHSIIADLSDFETTTKVYLQDLMTAATHDLRTGPYNFNSTIVNSNNRFNLLFTVIQQDDNILPSTVSVYSYDQVLYINTPSESFIEIYDVLGKQIVRKKSFAGVNQIQLSSKGIYLVKVIDDERIYTLKVLVQ